jgi:TolB-like protein/Flp pilus assembly protein TadD/DNA-binding winged helix-turn-helix (wHTH) protein
MLSSIEEDSIGRRVMDASSLRDGFRVSDWLIEPRASRATDGSGRVVELTQNQTQLLVTLALRHGEAVGKRTLREALWPDATGSDDKLRETIASLRALFGENPRHPRYIASVGQDGYALVAHFEPAPQRAEPVPARPAARLHRLLTELRRRSVIKVGASYLLAMWIILQVAQVTFAPLHFPGWWMTALTILAILGLPIVIVLAWTYEITPQGVVVDPGSGGAGLVNLPKPRHLLAPAIVFGVAAMAGVTGLAWWRTIDTPVEFPGAGGTADTEPGPQSVAVLPLVDLSPSGGNAWLGDGLSEELSTRLAQVPGLRVAARTSAFEFRGKNLDVRRIGQSLGVRHVLEGSVRREGEGVRVTVQLIDARTGYHVWAGNFDRAWRDVLTLQDDIARSVTAALQVVLMDTKGGAAAARATLLDARAVDPYLEGLALLRQPGDRSSLAEAQQAFRAAIAIAPDFAGAHAGLCRALARSFDQSRDRRALDEAEVACQRSLALDATLIDTEKALAGLYVSDGKFRPAADSYSRVIARNPRDADALLGLGQAYEGLGRAREAEASLRKATEIEPAYWSTHMALGRFLFQRGRADEALAAFSRVTELVPASAVAWSNVGAALQLKGDLASAEKAYAASLKLEPSRGAYSNVATIQFVLGRFDDAARNFEKAVALGEHDQVVHGNLADALWQIEGRREEAVRVYGRAIKLAEQELASTPNDSILRAQVGYYYGRIGEAQRSLAYLDEALRAGPELLYVQYYRGVAAADRGDRETALAAVSDMIRLGYPREQLRSAPEFRSLLADPEYKKLVG